MLVAIANEFSSAPRRGGAEPGNSSRHSVRMRNPKPRPVTTNAVRQRGSSFWKTVPRTRLVLTI